MAQLVGRLTFVEYVQFCRLLELSLAKHLDITHKGVTLDLELGCTELSARAWRTNGIYKSLEESNCKL